MLWIHICKFKCVHRKLCWALWNIPNGRRIWQRIHTSTWRKKSSCCSPQTKATFKKTLQYCKVISLQLKKKKKPPRCHHKINGYVRKGKKERNAYYIPLRPPSPGWWDISGTWALLDAKSGPCGGPVEAAQASENQQCLFPLDWDPNLQIQTGLHTVNPCQVHPTPGRPPGLQELFIKPVPRVLRLGLPFPITILRVAPPTSGSILSAAVLKRLGYVFRGEGDGQRGQERQVRGSLGWHIAFELTTYKPAFH